MARSIENNARPEVMARSVHVFLLQRGLQQHAGLPPFDHQCYGFRPPIVTRAKCAAFPLRFRGGATHFLPVRQVQKPQRTHDDTRLTRHVWISRTGHRRRD